MKTTHPLARRILAGIGISLFATIALGAMLVPDGAFEGRATSLRIDEPVEVTTTTVPPVTAPAYPVTEESVVTTTTTTKAPVVVPTTIGEAAVITAPTPPVAKQGHYACTGDDNESAGCVNDEAGPAHVDVNTGSDQPAGTLGVTNAAYGARLTDELCAAKPWNC